MLRARLAYTIARHSLRSLDALERLLLQVTRKNDARGYERFKDLQTYVGWNDADAARIKIFAHLIEAGMDALIDDFYAEIQRHPDTARVITGGQSQIKRLMGSLKA